MGKIWKLSNFRYLDVILDSNLTFKKHVKKVVNMVKFGLSNFRLPSSGGRQTIYACSDLLTSEILPHMLVTSKSDYSIESLYKQTRFLLTNQTVTTIVTIHKPNLSLSLRSCIVSTPMPAYDDQGKNLQDNKDSN
jgi:hypothetical protein